MPRRDVLRDPALLAAVSVASAGIAPMLLTAAMVSHIRMTISLPATALGLTLATYAGMSAVASVTCGRVVDRLGWRRSIILAGALSGSCLAGIGVFADSATELSLFMGAAGIANALAHPASNLAVASEINSKREGFAFGVKQSAIPVTMLAAGVSVPTLADTLGWRSTFLTVGFIYGFLCSTLPGAKVSVNGSPIACPGQRMSFSRPLLFLTSAVGLAAAGLNSLGAFLVDTAIYFDLTPGMAGMILAGAGAIGVISRIIAGLVADAFWDDLLGVTAVMLMASVFGLEMIARGNSNLIVFLSGVFVACAAGFGWSGLFNLALVRLYRENPGAASGMTYAGLWVGGIVGPPTFGSVSERYSHAMAWRMSGLFVVAAVACLWGARAVADPGRRG